MTIALLTDGIYPYVVGGMQKHSYNLAKYFSRQKIDVDLYHTIAKGSKYDATKLEVFTESEKKYIHPKLVYFPSKNYYPGHYLRESYQYSTEIYKQLLADKLPDFIYAQGYTAWKLLKQKRKGKPLPPIAVNFHGLEMFQQSASLKSKLQQLLLKDAATYNLINADYVFTYGGKMSDLLLKVGCKQEQLIYSPNATERRWIEKEVTANNSPIRFLFIGRYERRKGIQELTQVLNELIRESNLNFEFHFIGPIPERERITSAQIKYHGSVIDFALIKSIMVQMDILVCPSIAEGMPTVILEAMATGMAIIATDTGGTQNWVTENTGWLIQPGATKELKHAIISAVACSKELLTSKKGCAKQLVEEKYLWEDVINATIQDIDSILVSKSIGTRN